VIGVCPENDHRVFRCHECVDKRVFADGAIPLYMPVAFRISSDRSDHDSAPSMYNKSVFRSFLLRLLRLNCICSRNQNISRVVFVYGGDVGIKGGSVAGV
jgi:hypothetical protein